MNKSTKINTQKTVISSVPPVETLPELVTFRGQKGLIPLTVKLSANKCVEYPKKKGSAKSGEKKAKSTERRIQKV